MSHNANQSDQSGTITIAAFEAQNAIKTVLADPMRAVRYGLPWFGVLFMMALPLPFLGFLDGAQVSTPSGLDFSPFAATLALILHGAIWLRAIIEQDFPTGIPLPFGIREIAIVTGGVVLIGIPIWCWMQVGGLLFSMEHRFFATHKLAGWFGHRTILDYGIPEAINRATIAYSALAIITTMISIRFSLIMVDLVQDKNLRINAVWDAINRVQAVQLGLALAIGAAPFLAVAGIAQTLVICCGLPGPVVGIFQIIGTLALFPASAAIAITLGRMSRHLGYHQ